MKTNKEIPWNIYKKYLPLAEQIVKKLFGEPKSSQETADQCNKRGDIIKILIKNSNE